MKRSLFLLSILLGLFIDLSAQHTSRMPPVNQNGANDFFSYPIEEIFHDCNGDLIVVTGTMMVMFHLPPDASLSNIKARFALQDGPGTNLTTGEKYHVIDQQSFILRVYNNSVFTFITTIQHLHIIGERSGTSLRATYLTHLMKNPDGTWEEGVDHVTVKCDGESTVIHHY